MAPDPKMDQFAQNLLNTLSVAAVQERLKTMFQTAMKDFSVAIENNQSVIVTLHGEMKNKDSEINDLREHISRLEERIDDPKQAGRRSSKRTSFAASSSMADANKSPERDEKGRRTSRRSSAGLPSSGAPEETSKSPEPPSSRRPSRRTSTGTVKEPTYEEEKLASRRSSRRTFSLPVNSRLADETDSATVNKDAEEARLGHRRTSRRTHSLPASGIVDGKGLALNKRNSGGLDALQEDPGTGIDAVEEANSNAVGEAAATGNNMFSWERWDRWRSRSRGRYNYHDWSHGGGYRTFWPSWWNIHPYGYDRDTHETTEPEIEEKPEVVKPLVLKNLNLNIEQNAIDHHTDEYDLTRPLVVGEKKWNEHLIIRRGQDFDIIVEFDRPYEEEKDKLQISLDIGNHPKISKGTSKVIDLKKGLMPRKWSGEILKAEDNSLTLRLKTGPESFIGKWHLRIDTLRKDENDVMNVEDYSHEDPIYVLFNPWCKDDQVYMPNEVDRDEYVINDAGKIFTGNYRQIGSKPWKFGQFDDLILEISLYLLDHSGLNVTSRHNPVQVARAISRVANSSDDDGVLVGNWSGDYDGGTAPTHWVGSDAILEEFWETKQPVQYGQCWVFSGVVTAICRSLGMPCRSVTNFSSAHDCDGSVTIDYHYQGTEPIDEWNEDSVWNFHVWNETWMSRPDLGPHYAGWQAFDATPQETSDGVYQAGPCPVSALRRGDLTVPHDGPFIFAEVNADKVHWFLQEDGSWEHKIFNKHSVGRFISTKRPRNELKPKPSSASYTRGRAEDPDRLDLTLDYKFKEGSEEERAAVYRANTFSTLPWVYDSGEEADVTFDLEEKDDILVGNNFDITVKLQNKSRSIRTVSGTVTLKTSYYTGIPIGKVKSQEFDITLDPIKAGEAVMRVTAEEYLHMIVDQVSFRVSVICSVKETNQIYADDDTFRLRRPDLNIQAPRSQLNHEDFEAVISFQNPLPVSLTQCEWQIEGAGLEKVKRVKQKDLEAYDKVEFKVTLRPKRLGKRQIMASFSSKELMDVTGSCDIEIVDSDDTSR